MPPAYAAARYAAERIVQHLADYRLTAAEDAAEAPGIEALAALIDIAFWTSLRREETFTPRVSLSYVAREQVEDCISFAASLPLAPKDLTKLAAAVDRPGLHLGVWPDGNGGVLRVWGITRSLPALCVVVEVVAPGLVVVKRSPALDSGKFINVAVLQGDEVKIIDPAAVVTHKRPALLTSLLCLESQFASGSVVNVLLQLAVSTRAHGRGGTLLVVPSNSTAWNESILQPITYAVQPAFSRLGDLIRRGECTAHTHGWERDFTRAVDGVAGLTAVDGATVISTDYDLLAFGAKIVRRRGSPQIAQVMVAEPVEGGRTAVVEPAQLGGTRHISAAQFVHDQHDSIALVASQDGRFTVFAWSPEDRMVHVLRIDSLLL